MDCSLPGSSVHGFSRQEYWSGLPFPSSIQQSKYQKMWIIGGYLDGCLSELDINSLRENGDPLDYCQTNQSAFQFHLKVFLFRLAKPKFLPHIGALSLSCTHTHKLASTYKFCIHDFSNWNHQFFRKVKS